MKDSFSSDRTGDAWQPIATAPQDRTYVLLWVKTRWGKLADALPLAGWGQHGYWYCVNGDEAVSQVKPTHWMPLPPAPGSQADTDSPRSDEKNLPEGGTP
jgi:hypothetical protein